METLAAVETLPLAQDVAAESVLKKEKLMSLVQTAALLKPMALPTSPAPMSSPTPKTYRVVIKVGTSSLVNQETGIKVGQAGMIMEAVASLRRAGHSVLLVTSGAVGTGAHELGILERPTTTCRKQALAAVGQVRLMRELNSMLSTLGVESAQVLLTYGNFSDRQQSLNAQNTIEELFRLGVVPVVNENDTVATETLRFGDNDRLAGMVACLVNADMCFLLTDVNGLYTANPNVDPMATKIDIVTDIPTLRSQIKTDSGPGSSFSTGGMDSKLQAAQIATRGGVRTVIMSASDVRVVPSFVEECFAARGTPEIPRASFGTVCVESENPIKGRKRWIQSLNPRGKIVVGTRATVAMKMRKTFTISSVRSVEGDFSALDSVNVVSPQNELLGTGLCNFSSEDLKKVIQFRSEVPQNPESTAVPDTTASGYAINSLTVFDRDNLAWTSVL